MCNSSFEAIITSDKDVGIRRNGTEVKLYAWLPQRAADIPADRYAALQEEFDGKLVITHSGKRVIVEQAIVVCSSGRLRRAKLKLASAIKSELDLIATIQ